MELIKGGREYQGYRAGYQQLIVLDDGVKLVMISRPGYNGDPNQYHKDLFAFCDTGEIYSVHPAEDGLAGVRWEVDEDERNELSSVSTSFQKHVEQQNGETNGS
tara:strand:+ start:317 stop:628 length:312 start_codon:yes stop_codon:yes gene_type:complete